MISVDFIYFDDEITHRVYLVIFRIEMFSKVNSMITPLTTPNVQLLLFVKFLNQSYHFYAIVQIFIVGQLLSKFAHIDRLVEYRIN